MHRRVIVLAFLTLAAWLGGSAPVAAGLITGDVLVSDLNVPALFSVDPTTGNRTIFSGGGIGTGTAFSGPEGIAVGASGTVLVADNGVAALFTVDPTTGNRTLLTGDGAGSGQALVTPFGVAVGSGGQIYVADAGDQAGDSFVARVDPTTGASTLISGLGAGSGDAFSSIRGILAAPNGTLYVTDVANQALYSVNPTTGARTILSDATHGTGISFGAPAGLTFDSSGNILIADASDGAIIRVDPATGNRTLFSTGGTGPQFTLPFGVTTNASGQILVADSGDSSIPTLPTVFLVNPTTGNSSILSDANNGTGTAFQNLDLGIAVYQAPVPEPSSIVLMAVASSLCLLAYGRTRKRA